MTAIILSGGDNKRIQREKSFISISQKSIIEREIEVLSAVFSRIIIVTNRKKSYKHLKRNGWGRRGFLKEKGVKSAFTSTKSSISRMSRKRFGNTRSAVIRCWTNGSKIGKNVFFPTKRSSTIAEWLPRFTRPSRFKKRLMRAILMSKRR